MAYSKSIAKIFDCSQSGTFIVQFNSFRSSDCYFNILFLLLVLNRNTSTGKDIKYLNVRAHTCVKGNAICLSDTS